MIRNVDSAAAPGLLDRVVEDGQSDGFTSDGLVDGNGDVSLMGSIVDLVESSSMSNIEPFCLVSISTVDIILGILGVVSGL